MTQKTGKNLLAEYSATDVLTKRIVKIIRDNDVDGLRELMFSNSFSALSKKQIESIAFRFVYSANSDNELLKYLIFEYGIQEEFSINLMKSEVSHIVKQMFQTRNLNEELSSELSNKEQSNKKSKI